jgi:hypothetical protein
VSRIGNSRKRQADESMKPAIFSARPTGNTAQQYLHRARMFREAAVQLPDYRNGEEFWPKYALLTHAIELSLKAFAQHSVENGSRLAKNLNSMTCSDGTTWPCNMVWNPTHSLPLHRGGDRAFGCPPTA